MEPQKSSLEKETHLQTTKFHVPYQFSGVSIQLKTPGSNRREKARWMCFSWHHMWGRGARFRVGGDFFCGEGSGMEEFDWPQQKKAKKNRLIKSNKTLVALGGQVVEGPWTSTKFFYHQIMGAPRHDKTPCPGISLFRRAGIPEAAGQAVYCWGRR